jgi:diguanylate cyclase (GGDEF)-like protein
MLGDLLDLGALLSLLLVKVAVAALVVAILVAVFRWWRVRRAAEEAGRSAPVSPGFSIELAAAQEQLAAAREELVVAQRRAERNERLLLMLPECTKQLVNVWLPEDEISNVVVRQVKSLLDPGLVALFLHDSRTGLLKLAGGFGLPTALQPGDNGGPGLSLRTGEGKVGLAAELKVLVDDAKYEYEWRQATPGGVATAGLRVDLAAPILSHDEVLGVLAIRGSRQPADYQRWLLTMLAELTAVAIGTAQNRQEISLEATTDPLTGLFNRKYLAERLSSELHRAEAYGSPLSVILFDVDNFKHYNDANGHPAGDACLKAVARITQEVTRSSHFVARYGGEEFLVIAPGADREQALAAAEGIRAAIASADIEAAAAQPLGCLSVSLGVASVPAHGRTMPQLIEAADAALYRSKQAGRNRVTEASSGFLSDIEAPVVEVPHV